MSKTPDIREAIRHRLEELNQNTLWLANQCDGEPQKNHLYAFLSKKQRGGMSIEYLEKIMSTLGMDLSVILTPRKAPAKRPRPATPPAP